MTVIKFLQFLMQEMSMVHDPVKIKFKFLGTGAVALTCVN